MLSPGQSIAERLSSSSRITYHVSRTVSRTVSRILRHIGILLLLFLGPLRLFAQPASVNGFVTDAANGALLELVNLSLQDDEGALYGAVTNRDGLYLIPRLTPGRYRFKASFIGYETYTDTLTLAAGERRILNVALTGAEATLGEVLVEAEAASGATRVTAGRQTIRPRDIELVPAPDLAGDLAALLTTLPGVVTLGDRGGQLFIRGGEAAQNLVQLDGVLVYQPFHILGFYSAFPSDIISRADLYAGGFGGKFGERISSVIDISTRNGNNRRFSGAATLSPFISTALVEGPIIQDRLSLLASVRQSVVEEGASRVINRPLPFTFGDVFAKLHGVVNANSRLSALVLHTHDRGTLAEDRGGVPPEEIRWQNTGAGLRFVTVPRFSSFLADLRLAYSRLNTEQGLPDAPVRRSTIENFNVAADLTFMGASADVDVGMSVRVVTTASALGGLYQNIEAQRDRLEHVAVYVEPEYRLGGGLRLRPAIRVQFFDIRFNPFLEPRVRLVWEGARQQLSGAFGVYHQAILGLTDRRDAASVFTVWTNVPRPKTGLEDVRAGRAQRAVHGLLGYRITPTSWLEVSAEGFYKRLSNLFIGEWTAFPRFTTNLQPAVGRSYGFDVRVEVHRNAFYGYVTYGYAATRYTAEQASLLLWYGQETLRFNPPHDRRHQVNALASRSFGGFDVSVRWAFGSGLPFSRALGFDGFALIDDVVNAAEIPGFRRVIYERPFNARLPTYHRLDVSVERTFPLRVVDLTVQGSVINLYDRRNLFYLDVFTLRRVDQLPLVPSFGLKITFR